MLESEEELLELLELEQLVAGGINGVVRSAPQACSNRVANKNPTTFNVFEGRKFKLIIAV